MKCLILAAGYATRLYPLTEHFPKPLLKVQDKPILDWLIEDISNSKFVDEFIVISNHKFCKHFKDWALTRIENITIVDDGTSSNETRLGAVMDINYAIEAKNIQDDLLILAGDNLLDFSLGIFIFYAMSKKTSCVMRYFEESQKKLQKSGVLVIDENDKIIEMQEKPQEPKSNWCCPAFYYYTKDDVALIKQGIKEGCGVDAPGSFVSWLCKKHTVYAMEMPGSRYDIGDINSYNKVQEEYKGIQK